MPTHIYRITNTERTPMRLRLALVAMATAIVFCSPASAGAEDRDDPLPFSGITPPVALTKPDGEKLARSVCGACHVFPEPQLLDKTTWLTKVLPRMETRLGVSPPDYSSSPEGDLIRTLGIYPDEPLIPKSDWDAIVEFYRKSAPDTPLPQQPRPEIQVGLPQFSVAPVRFRNDPPLTTLVQFGSRGELYLGDDGTKSLAIVDSSGVPKQTIALGNVPIGIKETGSGIYVTAIGSFQPSEVRRAELLYFPRENGILGSKKVILKDLPRAAHTEFADFNGDGRMDFAICLFGNLTGRFSWFENAGDDNYKEHVLIEKPGSIRCATPDLNGDGSPDLVVLVAQESEALYLFYNDGKGNFSSRLVFQKHPVYGHNHFELADFDGDGRQDLLVANGDNGEYDSPLKNYHGIRIYLDRGEHQFEEAYFFPLNGATKAVARDFDQDGDLDIAAISFFPDYITSPRESFVYLENKGGFNFAPATFSQCIAGRWVSMDVRDMDHDGDLDIALGSYTRGPTSVPAFLAKMWESKGPSALILKNRLKKSNPAGSGQQPVQE